MNRVLILGSNGQVGKALQATAPAGVELLLPTSSVLDLRDGDALRAYVVKAAADTIINCAAFTRVDDAEVERADANAINAVAPRILAEESARTGARLLHVSTDYVFDGMSGAPYVPESSTAPLNVYGSSKRDGETAVMATNPAAAVVRTAWVHSGGGVNFIATAVRVLRSGKSMRVVDDQVSTPTRAKHLAQYLWALAASMDVAGMLHFTDAGVASWYDVAHCVAETLRQEGLLGDDVGVSPVDSSAFPRPAARPKLSLLDKHASWERVQYAPIHWRDGVIASTHELIHA
jgi:dTDP-4-dehydrorhamnose reductase